ncbi:hypothetical protein Hanom_Chr03g00219031 [Helianthus anomalus]
MWHSSKGRIYFGFSHTLILCLLDYGSRLMLFWWCPTMVASHTVERIKLIEKVSCEGLGAFSSYDH